jgi:outer membrane protein assembly factor BamB
MSPRIWTLSLAAVIAAFSLTGQQHSCVASDWPMWRYDAARSAAATDALPDELHLQWTRQYSPRRQVWDDELNLDLMSYDRVFEPVVMDGRLFLGFNDRDKLVAFDAATGAELWTYYTEGPVRLPPACEHGRVYFASDDGHLYCVDAADGKLRWKFRGGPSSRLSIGNRRLISIWPARGGPVLRDGKVYFTASIWPFMGTFIYALDSETGDVIWVNDETGAQYIKQPHSAPSFAGVAPQGTLAATQDTLIVPGGRSVPAVFNRHTGKQLYFEIGAGGKGIGGSFVAATEDSWFVHTRRKGTREFSLKDGTKTELAVNEPVIVGDRIYSAEDNDGRPIIRARDRSKQETLWELPADGRGDLILAGQTLYAAGLPNEAAKTPGKLTAIRLPSGDAEPQVLWTLPISGSIERLIAANGQLFAVTQEGSLLAWGTTNTENALEWTEEFAAEPVDPATDKKVTALLSSGDAEGYALWMGASDSTLVAAIAARSQFAELTIVDESSDRVAALRRQLDVAGRYGKAVVHRSSLNEYQPPPYFANMLFIGSEHSQVLAADSRLLTRLYNSVRPYGGVLYLLTDGDRSAELQQRVQALHLERAEVDVVEFGVRIRRVGSLPGAGQWTHQHGDIANTRKSDDELVKLPLGVLWFGGSSHADVLPRHGHGPPEQVVGGRLIIQGMNLLTARDVYTGRVLWKREFEDLGTNDVYFDETYKETPLDTAYNQVHIPGANARGANYVVTADRIYIVVGNSCQVLDPATGETMTEISLPQKDPSQPNEWGFIGVYEDVLIGGVGFAKYRSRHEIEAGGVDLLLSRSKAGFGIKSLDRAASMALVGFDRHTGKQLWHVDATHSFWHNGIVAGKGLVYALDKNPKPVEEYLQRRGKSAPSSYRVLAFDARTGQTAWEKTGDVFGTWLGYSETHDLLLQAGAAGSDRLISEVGQGMAVYRGQNGEVVWRHNDLRYSGPCVLHNDLIITNANSYSESAGAFYLADGTQKMVKNPLTGVLQPWKITRAYGCNTLIASQNLLTFRSGAAGFYDLLTEAGTGNFGGFKSGCTANLVVADGVLNAPDYTRTCSCAYQNQTSLALVHMPELDAWTNSNSAVLEPDSGRIRQIGVNLGAPGDRRDPHGLMWLEYPVVSGDSPDLGLEFTGSTNVFQHHPSSAVAASLPWVAASGVEGLTGLKLRLQPTAGRTLKAGIVIAHADDDAEETTDGSVNIVSSRLEMAQKDGQQLVGLRFTNLPLQRAAKVRAAALQFVCHTVGDEPTELVIQAEAVDNASRFTEKRGDLSQRSLTQSKVFWTVPAWKKEKDAGDEQRSPDLTSLVREVINRPDWKPGNSIVFVISGKGLRIAPSFQGRTAETTKLLLDADAVDTPVEAVPYRVRLHFGAPRGLASTRRVFDVRVQGQPVSEPVVLGGNDSDRPAFAVRTIERVLLTDHLEIEFLAKEGIPLVSGIELQRLDD